MLSNSHLFEGKNQKIITFPKVEWDHIKKELDQHNVISTTRNSCGVKKTTFKLKEIYTTQWGDNVEIIKAQSFLDPVDIPTWFKMNKVMKDSILYGVKMCGVDNLQWIHLKKVS